MDSDKTVPANQNSQVYRSFSPVSPPIYKFLEFIDIKDENMIIGSSNLCGRKWDGIMCYYNNFSKDEFSVENITTSQMSETCVTDGKFLDQQTIVVGEDSGVIKIFKLDDNDKTVLKELKKIHEHEDMIAEISCWENSKNFVTCTYDSSIKVWELSNDGDLVSISTYSNAHSDVISSVNAHPNDLNLFVSCSYDKTGVLWDKRQQTSTLGIYKNEFCNLTQIKWHKTNNNLVAIGNSAGYVYTVDIRHATEFVSRSDCYKHSIHRTSFSNNGLLAVCYDDSIIRVFDCENEVKLIYENDDHSDMVRGLKWQEEKLVSCGWDQKVIFHKLSLI